MAAWILKHLAPSALTRYPAFIAMTMLVLLSAQAGAAVSTWVAAGTTSNFSDALNWDAPPTPGCDLVFPAGAAFASKGAPVNDLTGQTVNALDIYEAYTISGNGLTCQIINDYNATGVNVALPLATAGTAALTVTVTTAGATLNLSGLISGAGPATYGGPGTTRLDGSVSNTLSGLTSVSMGFLVLNGASALAIAGPMIIDSGATVTVMTAPSIADSATVTVNGTFDLASATGNDGADTETIGGLYGNGTITLGANTLGCTAQSSASTFSGGFSGTGGFRQFASGTQVLSGTSANTGVTTLSGGSIHVWGSQAASPVQVTAGTLVLANNCIVGDVILSGGATSTLSFNETISAMTLQGTAASLTIGSGSTFQVVAKGAPATMYSNIDATAVSIANAVLTVDTSNYTPAVGSVMTIINNIGSSAVIGTFAGLPEGATLASSTNAGTAFTVSYIAGTGHSVTLTCVTTIPAPVIISALSASATLGTAFAYGITASNSPSAYNATGLPSGLTVNTATGMITGNPAATGTTAVTISASNGGGVGMATLTLTVHPVTAGSPAVTSAVTASGTLGSAFSYTIAGSNTPTSFNATGLPSGLSVDTATGVISGTPTATGTSNVTVTATNSSGTGVTTLTITIGGAAPAEPVITSAVTASGIAGTPFTYDIQASNGATSFGASPLPAGIVIDTATGHISGTPTAAGMTTVVLSAGNAGGTGTTNLALTIAAAAGQGTVGSSSSDNGHHCGLGTGVAALMTLLAFALSRGCSIIPRASFAAQTRRP